MFSQLQHLPRHQDAAARGAAGERADHGLQSFGVGVVTVVEDGGAGQREGLAALVTWFERRNGRGGGIKVDPRFNGDGERGHGVLGVVRAGHAQLERAFSIPGAEADAEAILVFRNVQNLRIGARPGAEINRAAGKVAAKLSRIFIVAIEERDAGCRQRGDQLEFGAGDAGLAVRESLNVRGAHVGDHAPVGSGDPGQRGDFAGVVHAHLHHRVTRAPARCEEAAAAGRRRYSGCRAT